MKCIEHTRKESLFLLRDLSEHWTIRSTSVCLKYQKKMYINKLDEIVNKYNKTYNSTIKIKLPNVQPSTYIEYGVDHNDKNLKFKVGDRVRISKYKNVFAKGYTPNRSKDFFCYLESKKDGTLSMCY